MLHSKTFANTTNNPSPGSCKGPYSPPPMPTPRSTMTRHLTAERNSIRPSQIHMRASHLCTTPPVSNTAAHTRHSPSQMPTGLPCSRSWSHTPPHSDTRENHCSCTPDCPPPTPLVRRWFLHLSSPVTTGKGAWGEKTAGHWVQHSDREMVSHWAGGWDAHLALYLVNLTDRPTAATSALQKDHC